jgi:Methane oxygenase PmoA
MIKLLSVFFLLLAVNLQADDFSWHDTPGKFLDLKYKEIPVARYQYEPIDTSTAERRDETYKPFHHIYDPAGKEFITKGPGGKFPHHRGIYFGFSKCSYTDAAGKEFKNIDTWHCRKAHQVHRKMVSSTTNAQSAAMTSEIGWIDDGGIEFASEERTLTFAYNDKKDLMVGFHSVVTPKVPKMKVDGDPQHAGFHFRASNEVSEKTLSETYYIRPVSGIGEKTKTINWSAKDDTESTRDLPWKGLSFMAGGNRYTVAYIDSPKNPKPARFSERDYGRFGSYFVKELTPAEPLQVQYKLVIRAGEMTPEEIAAIPAP